MRIRIMVGGTEQPKGWPGSTMSGSSKLRSAHRQSEIGTSLVVIVLSLQRENNRD
ncbi:hypothetical protein ACP179_01075 (plasmid) [Xenorhabdus stockiae]|uniref:hypothetical protein n=1 Tax=Xenorhabdus stockiae TaxID=351614 RepID=UPI003CFA49F0